MQSEAAGEYFTNVNFKTSVTVHLQLRLGKWAQRKCQKSRCCRIKVGLKKITVWNNLALVGTKWDSRQLLCLQYHRSHNQCTPPLFHYLFTDDQ